jgi:hypothetical protein
MKKFVAVLGLLIWGLMLFGQQIELPETLVKSPRFMSEKMEVLDESHSAIGQYMQQQLTTGVNDATEYAEGVVVVEFTIHADGSLSNFIVDHSVSARNDNAVLNVVKNSEGMWEPGQNNDQYVDMKKRLYVGFTDPESPGLRELATEEQERGLRKYYKVAFVEESPFLSNEKIARRKTRLLRAALNNLDAAYTYQPEEPSTLFWQACVYEKLGDEDKKNEKMFDFMNLLDPNYFKESEYIAVVMR